jgi:uncharacterized protein YkwD
MDAPMEQIPVPQRAPRRRHRLRLYSVTALAGLTMLVTQCAPQQCAPAPTGLSPALQQVVDLTNQHRDAAGLPALRVNAQLNAAAQRMSDDMAAHDTIQPGSRPHYGSDGTSPGDRIAATGYSFRAWGENIASGYRDAVSVDQGWFNSPGHQANMVSSNFTEIGVAVSYSASGVAYWTQDFAAPR